MTPRTSSWTDRDVVIVACVVVAGGILAAAYVVPLSFLGFLGTSPGETPLGTNFATPHPQMSQCATNASYSKNGCFGGDYVYRLSIETGGGLAFDNLEFEVTNSSGTVVSLFSNGGFSVINWTGVVQSSSSPSTRLAMSGSWSTYTPWVSGSTPLSQGQEILIDMGGGNPSGAHLNLTATGMGGYTGTVTAPLP